MRAFVVILAAGRGERFGSDKVLQNLGGRPVWQWSYDLFRSLPEVSGVGIVCSHSNISAIRPLATEAAFVIEGGENRQESSRYGAEASPEDADVILVHDAARPFVSADVVRRVMDGIEEVGAAAAAVGVVDTLRERTPVGPIILNRDKIVAMQTPQGARRFSLVEAHQEATQSFTDEMALLESAGCGVKVVDGSPANFKITTMEDLERARASVGGGEVRTGLGYDVHRFSTDPERPLILGGLRFEEGPGLEGHSDADVLIHAAVDALLGAAALGDIGQHFPPSDDRWKDEPSLTFLMHARDLLRERGWRIINLDIAVLAEKPRIMPHASEMRRVMAAALDVSADRVSVKATTNEGLGSIGRGEGIAAFATATIGVASPTA
jgi:2-C-methyl-D-erythritol 4-phosphate cytidylyltransferase/2-C-methyl-D-erythritol 2,4-cyclodiphosphate synthase